MHVEDTFAGNGKATQVPCLDVRTHDCLACGCVHVDRIRGHGSSRPGFGAWMSWHSGFLVRGKKDCIVDSCELSNYVQYA